MFFVIHVICSTRKARFERRQARRQVKKAGSAHVCAIVVHIQLQGSPGISQVCGMQMYDWGWWVGNIQGVGQSWNGRIHWGSAWAWVIHNISTANWNMVWHCRTTGRGPQPGGAAERTSVTLQHTPRVSPRHCCSAGLDSWPIWRIKYIQNSRCNSMNNYVIAYRHSDRNLFMARLSPMHYHFIENFFADVAWLISIYALR